MDPLFYLALYDSVVYSTKNRSFQPPLFVTKDSNCGGRCSFNNPFQLETEELYQHERNELRVGLFLPTPAAKSIYIGDLATRKVVLVKEGTFRESQGGFHSALETAVEGPVLGL